MNDNLDTTALIILDTFLDGLKHGSRSYELTTEDYEAAKTYVYKLASRWKDIEGNESRECWKEIKIDG